MPNSYLKCRIVSFSIIVFLVFSGMLIIVPTSPVVSYSEGHVWSISTDSKFKMGTINNLTIHGVGEGARLELVNQSEKWNLVEPNSTVPSGKWKNLAPIWGTDKILYFGGGHTEVTNQTWPRTIQQNVFYYDTWIYDYSDNKWINVTPLNSPFVLGRKMVSIYGSDKVLLFGGQFNTDNMMWIYDLSENTWKEITPTYRPAIQEYDEVASFWGTDKVLFVGCGASGTFETWIFHLSDNTWTRKTPGERPIPRRGPGLAAIEGTDKILLFGGYGYSTYDEYTWVYDLSDNTWTKKAPISNPNVLVHQKMETIFGTDKTFFFDEYKTDLTYPPPNPPRTDPSWIYDHSDDEWVRRWLAGAEEDMYGRNIWGTDLLLNFGSTKYNRETWIYDIFNFRSDGYFISTPFDTGAQSYFEQLSWDGETPLDSQVKIQIRTASTFMELMSANFVGPEGTTNSYYTARSNHIWAGHTGDRYTQYKVYLEPGKYSDTPKVKEVSIKYNGMTSSVPISPGPGDIISNNKPMFVWKYYDPDSNIQSAFQILIDNNIEFNSINFDSTVQYSTADRWQFPAGTSYGVIPDGTWYWRVRTMDANGDWGPFSITYKLTIDTRPPQSAPLVPLNNAFYNSLDTISGVALDDKVGSGVDYVEILVKRVSDNYYWSGAFWSPLKTWLDTEGTEEWEYDSGNITWSSGSEYLVKSSSVDLVGNREAGGIENSFVFDNRTPKYLFLTINNDDVYTSNSTVTLSIESKDHGYQSYQIAFSTDGSIWTNWEKFVETKTFTLSNGDGEKFVHAKVKDKAGNVGGSVFDSIILDTTPPRDLGIQINGGAATTNSTSVSLSLSATDDTSGLKLMSFRSGTSRIWSTWENFSTNRSWVLNGGDGLKTVYFRVSDNAGNVAKTVYDTIVLNTSAGLLGIADVVIAPDLVNEDHLFETDLEPKPELHLEDGELTGRSDDDGSRIDRTGVVNLSIIIVVLIIVAVFFRLNARGRKKDSGKGWMDNGLLRSIHRTVTGRKVIEPGVEVVDVKRGKPEWKRNEILIDAEFVQIPPVRKTPQPPPPKPPKPVRNDDDGVTWYDDDSDVDWREEAEEWGNEWEKL